VKFQASFDKSHHLFVKCSRPNVCENLDDTQHDLQYPFCSQIVFEQEIIVAAITIALFIFTRI